MSWLALGPGGPRQRRSLEPRAAYYAPDLPACYAVAVAPYYALLSLQARGCCPARSRESALAWPMDDMRMGDGEILSDSDWVILSSLAADEQGKPRGLEPRKGTTALTPSCVRVCARARVCSVRACVRACVDRRGSNETARA